MCLLVERAVVESEADAARDLLGQLRPVAIREAVALPPERERAERPPAHDHRHGQHRADADRLNGHAVLGAAVGGIREVRRRGDDLRFAGPDGDGDRRVALQRRGIALHHARRLLHPGIPIDDHEAPYLLARDEVDHALVGEARARRGRRACAARRPARASARAAPRSTPAGRASRVRAAPRRTRARARAHRRTARPASRRTRARRRRRRARARSGSRAPRACDHRYAAARMRSVRLGPRSRGSAARAGRPRGTRACRSGWPRRWASAARAGRYARGRPPRP